MAGAVFQPELIELMKSVLEEAAAALPEAKRTSTIKDGVIGRPSLWIAEDFGCCASG
jgi:hypothetical protein